MVPMKECRVSSADKQRGAVLLMGLIMVLLMTIVGLAAIRGSGLQEIMAGNMRDRNVAFQASEAGLGAAEEYVETTPLEETDFDGSTTGLVMDLGATGKTRIEDWTAEDWAAAIEVGFDLEGVAEQPRYVIEKVDVSEYDLKRMLSMSARDSLPINVNFYRVSSRGVGATGNSDAVVQSNYVKLN